MIKLMNSYKIRIFLEFFYNISNLFINSINEALRLLFICVNFSFLKFHKIHHFNNLEASKLKLYNKKLYYSSDIPFCLAVLNLSLNKR